MSLLTIGTVAYDAIETPFVKTDKVLGGSCTYIAHAAAYFADKVNVTAVVGDDFDKQYIDNFHKSGINTEGLQIKEGEKSFFWSGKYHNNMNNRDTLITDLNVLENFDPILPASYQDCKYLMLGNLTPAIQLQVLERLETRPKFIAMDTMNLWIDIANHDLKDVIAKTDLLIINDEEARLLTNEYSLVNAAEQILAYGLKYVIIKKGEHGALVFSKDEIFSVPALPLKEVVDPTGAGDAFAGGLIGYLTKTDDSSFENLKKAVFFGSVMASFCVEKLGPDNINNLSQTQIKERLEAFTKLVNFDKDFDLD